MSGFGKIQYNVSIPMSDTVQVAIIVSTAILLAILIIRGAINRLAGSRKDFVFRIRAWGVEFVLSRGAEKPGKSEVKRKQEVIKNEPKVEIADG